MADEAILNAARELQTRSEHADQDVRHELGLMTASVATAHATARTIDAMDAHTARHADGMARQLAADLRDAAAVLESSGASDRLVAAGLETVENDRFSPVRPATSPERPFDVPLPASPRSVGQRIEEYKLPSPSPFWTALANPLDLADELARAAADVAAIAAESTAATEKERPVTERPQGTKETA